MNTISLSCSIALGSILALAGCSSDDPPASNGTSGSSAGGSAGMSTGGSSAGATVGGGGAGTAGSMATGGGGAATGGGGAATGGGGAGGASGSGGAGGSAGAGGTKACDPGTGKALAFKNDKNDLITGDLGDDLAGGNGPRTIELWAHFLGEKSWAGEHTVIEIGRRVNNMANGVFGIDMADRTDANTGKFDPYTNGIGDNDPTPVMAPPEGWHHLAWGYDGAGKFQFVVDGVKVTLPHPDAGNGMLATTKGIVTLGGSQSFGTQGWEGEMDEVRIWSVFRSEADIKRDMKVKLKGSEAGLVAYYNLDEGTGTSADDINKKASHKLSFCAANGGACPTMNDAAPTWITSAVPGPFTCAP